ncbi:hypothetical protein, partial [Candidatus Bandiella numerosa]|uniref:hypothetical protein n=1 Tax=Candidatus Bandiella numerosa TaxID=2570586 RepID=UPI001F23913B
LSETLSRDTIEKPRLIPKPLIWLNYLCIYISSLTLYLLSNAKNFGTSLLKLTQIIKSQDYG